MKNQQVVPPVQRGGTEGLHPWDLRAESPQVVCSQRWSSGGSCYKDKDDMLIMVTCTITRLHQNTVVEKKTLDTSCICDVLFCQHSIFCLQVQFILVPSPTFAHMLPCTGTSNSELDVLAR